MNDLIDVLNINDDHAKRVLLDVFLIKIVKNMILIELA
jgi:hypothetical protein